MHVAEHAMRLESCLSNRWVTSLAPLINTKQPSEMYADAGRAVVTPAGDNVPHGPLTYLRHNSLLKGVMPAL